MGRIKQKEPNQGMVMEQDKKKRTKSKKKSLRSSKSWVSCSSFKNSGLKAKLFLYKSVES